MKECTGEAKEKEGEFDEMANSKWSSSEGLYLHQATGSQEVSL